MENILYSYTNGDSQVTIYQDGTKHRLVTGSNKIHPESIDVKITNYCDAKCSYCHEQSTIFGQHADLNKLSEILSVLPSGVEIAVGGGNPLSHPDLITFLTKCQKQGLICNMTINQKHIKPYQKLILSLIKDKLIYGLGVSYLVNKSLQEVSCLLSATDNLVFHCIMGINTVNDIDTLYRFCQQNNKVCKILILGYKEYGFGLNYYLKNKRIEDNKYSWYTELASFFKRKDLVLSFDNLAIKQLNLSRYFTKEAWSTFYMGDDGQYTMYIDAVQQKYAKSSTTDNRVDFEVELLTYFNNLVLGKYEIPRS